MIRRYKVEDIEVIDAEEIKVKKNPKPKNVSEPKKKREIVKVLNSTSRQSQVLFSDGTVGWVGKKTADSTKKTYL